jgi:hypothetical protein
MSPILSTTHPDTAILSRQDDEGSGVTLVDVEAVARIGGGALERSDKAEGIPVVQVQAPLPHRGRHTFDERPAFRRPDVTHDGGER